MFLDDFRRINSKSASPVIQCTQCGEYSLLYSNITQVCGCNTLLVYKNELQPQSNLLLDCKMCEQLALDPIRK
ncbi:MAG: hypothetical protein HeimC3_15630 [Candidatus Heimdallarchaeota archaeon LC_3]|nr:MAG: hypothetical protein HeimC3_15630 [Candidatus Heimdallarchaeota archaeon LC_3]